MDGVFNMNKPTKFIYNKKDFNMKTWTDMVANNLGLFKYCVAYIDPETDKIYIIKSFTEKIEDNKKEVTINLSNITSASPETIVIKEELK